MSWLSPRRVASAFIVFCLLFAAAFAFAQGAKVKTPGKYIEEPDDHKLNEQDLIRERHQWFMKGRQAPKGETPSGMRIKAFRQKQALREQNRKRFAAMSAANARGAANSRSGLTPLQPNAGGGPATSTPIFIPPWTALGPAPIGRENSGYGDVTGRVTAIAIDQSDPSGNTVYVGGAYGGVWKSTNAASADTSTITWTSLTDTEASLAANAIAISPADHNIILVGTGEPDFAGDSYYGVGILRSIDGGATWTLVTQSTFGEQFKGLGVSKFAWSTANPNLVVAAFSDGTITGSNTTPGFYYSTDAGATWTRGFSSTGGWSAASDVVYNAASNTFYGAMFLQGIFSSTDGIGWSMLPNQPFGLSVANCNIGNCDLLRASLASHPTKNEIYAIGVGLSGTTLKGVARTTNGAATSWTALSTTGITSCGDSGGCGAGQGFYDLVLAAVPHTGNNTTDLYVGMVNLYRASNVAAASPGAFSNITHVYGSNPIGAHPDYHSFDYLRSSPNSLYFGNDGGIYRSLSGLVGTGTAGAQNINAGLGSLGQFVSMSQHPTDSNVLLGGLQDNGSPSRDSSHFNDVAGAPEQTWVHIAGGDGGYNAINQTHPNLWSQSYVYVTIGQCDSNPAPGNDPNGTTGGCIPNALPARVVSAKGASYLGKTRNFPDEGQFYTPFILDPANQAKLIIGTCRVWRGNADGTGWGATNFANQLSNQLSGGNSSTANCTGQEHAVLGLAAGGPIVNGLSSVIYAGLDDAEIWVTSNAGTGKATWIQQSPFFNSPVADIAILGGNSGNGQTAFAALQSFGGVHVIKTVNGGWNWADITGNLPNVPTNSIAIDPGDTTGNTLYAGTDLGVFYTTNGGVNWAEYGPTSGAGAFPNSPVTKLLVFNSGGQHLLRASTYGRGVWQNVLATSIIPDYSLVFEDSPQSNLPGQTSTFHGVVTFLNGYTGTVNLTCGTGAPTNCNITPSSISSSGTTVTVDVSNASINVFDFNIHATDGTITHDAPLEFGVQAFTINATPATQVLIPGQSTTINVTNAADAAFTDTIALGCFGGLPAGITCSNFNPNPVAANGSSVLTLTTTTATPTQDVFIPIEGQATSNSLAVALTNSQIRMQNFTAGAVPTTLQTITDGNSQTFTSTFTAVNGFNLPITVGCTATLVPGITCNAVPPTVTPGTPSIVTVSTTNGVTPLATTTFQITGTALGATRASANLMLKTTNFQVTSTTPSSSVNAGSNGTIAVNVKALNGYAHPVALSCSNLPANVTCTFSTNNFTPASTGTAVTVTLNTTTAAAFGVYNTISLDVLGDLQTHSLPLTLTVKDFHLSLNPASLTLPLPPAGQTLKATTAVTFFADQGFNTAVTPGCVTPLPVGVTCAFSPTTITPTLAGVNSTLTLTSTSAAVSATNPLNIKGTAGTLIHQQPLTLTTGGPNFTQTVAPATQNVNAGASTAYTVTYTSLGGMNQDIAVGCVLPVALQPNVTCTPVPAIVTPGTTPGNSSVVTLSTTFGATPAANATVAIAGTSAALNNLTRSTNVNLSVKDFTVTRNTASVSTNVGANITDTVVVKGVNGFTGNVALVCAIEGAPVGTACNLSNANPAASASGTSVTATITSTAATTPPGSYLVDVTGTTSGGSKPTQFTVVIKDFTLGLGAGAITIPQPPPSQSSSLAVPITLTAESGFNSSTALSCLGQPSGITCSFSPASAIPTAIGLHSTLAVTSTGAVLPNTYHLQVKAAAGTLIRTQALDVTDFGPNFTQAVTPAMQNVVAGSATQYTVTYTPLGGMTQDIAVACTSTLPNGVHCSANPPIITPGTTGLSSVVTLSTDFGFALPVNTTVTISGVSAALNNLTRSNNVTLSVKDFTITANSLNIATNVGSNITDTILVKGVNGFTGNVALACAIVGTPVGTSCTLSNVNPAATSTGTSVTATIHSDAATTPTGDYTVQVTGTTGAGSHTAQFTVKIKGITLAINPTSLSIPSTGGNASTTVTTTALNGFTGAVTLSCATPLPTGITCGFGASNTASLSVTPTIAGTNTNLKVTATASAGAGLKNLTVKAVVGTLTLTKPLAATVTAASNAALSGTYTLLAYQQDTGSSQPMLGLDIPSTPFSGSVQQMNPTGFKSQYMTVTFDGSGHYSSTIQQNLDGVGSSPTQNGTYSVATDGSVSIDGGVVAGQVKADGSSFLVRQTPSHQPNIVVGIKNGGSAFTNASLSGTYTLLTYQHDTGSSQPTLGLDIPSTPFSGSVQQMNPTGFKSQYMTVVFDGANNYSASIQENVSGVGSSTSQNGTYSVAADGSVSIDGGVVAGHLSADASTFIVRQTPSQQPNIVVGIKNGGSAFTNASLTGTYTLLTYQHDTGSAQPTIPVNVPSTPFSGSVQQMNPTGFKSQYMTVTFDGAGNYSSNIQQNVDGAGSSPTQNGTYSVATDGSVSIDSGVVAGQLSADATTFVVRQTPTQQPNIVVGIKN